MWLITFARRMNTNIRELEGALNTVIMNAKVYNAPITVELATRALRGMTSTGPISLENIQKKQLSISTSRLLICTHLPEKRALSNQE